jgi:hypothetical protein
VLQSPAEPYCSPPGLPLTADNDRRRYIARLTLFGVNFPRVMLGMLCCVVVQMLCQTLWACLVLN